MIVYQILLNHFGIIGIIGIFGTFVRYTNNNTDDKVNIADIWCIFAFSRGTKFNKVRIPLKAW